MQVASTHNVTPRPRPIYIKAQTGKNRAGTGFFRAPSFFACLLPFSRIMAAERERIKRIVRGTVLFLDRHLRHIGKVCLRFRRWPRLSRGLACPARTAREGLRLSRPVSALLHFDTAAWFSGDTHTCTHTHTRGVTRAGES